MAPAKTLAITKPPVESANTTHQKQPESREHTPPGTLAEKWPQLRSLRIESAEENEYVNLLSEMNWVMKHCQVKLLGRVDRRELTDAQMDKALARLHDSLHRVRHALQSIFHLAGFRDYRFRLEETPRALPASLEPQTTPKMTEIVSEPA